MSATRLAPYTECFFNLPREERYKSKNVILFGLIPDMGTEPPANTFIQPLVDELLEAWHNFFSAESSSGQVVTTKMALTCVGCDIPATRKLC